ncbi:MAG: hypothetical protein ACFB12_15220 [Leptolyngbyaceae cyanobacterium]
MLCQVWGPTWYGSASVVSSLKATDAGLTMVITFFLHFYTPGLRNLWGQWWRRERSPPDQLP